ncbi:uncharacterized protein [Mytilus edulis]|uniref:uncharacterized protein n=1 Tax=Mytilus edulis TaxID=6550 RepID=UPI0039EE5F55
MFICCRKQNRRMKLYLCLIICLLLVCVGVNLAKEEMSENDGLIHELVKRSACQRRLCHGNRDCCRFDRCFMGRCRRFRQR